MGHVGVAGPVQELVRTRRHVHSPCGDGSCCRRDPEDLHGDGDPRAHHGDVVHGIYKEITPVSRPVYTESMCDADGNLIPPSSMGMPEGTPDVTDVIVALQEADGNTRLKIVHMGVQEGSAGEGGWNQAFDKLSEAL